MAAYTTIDDPSAYFKVSLHTGNNTNDHAITFDDTDTTMQPDLVWIKSRDNTEEHMLTDSVRPINNYLAADNTGPEDVDSDNMQSLDSNGFTMGVRGTHNANTIKYVAWCWKAGTTSSGTTTGSGTGTSYSTSINDTAGFQITTYTGNDTGGHTIPVALSTAPHLMIFKQRNDTYAWGVYHHKNTSAPETEVLELHGTSATADDNTFLNDVAPTSSVVTLGPAGDWGNEDSKTIVAYFWSEKQGYSKFGSYTGNGNADGAFIYTGFRPAWIMCKKSSASGDSWTILDNKRDTYNVADARLFADQTAAESTSTDVGDFLSNGFKIRTTAGTWNDSGGTYIYAAFAEAPFVNSNGVPCNAR